MLCSCSFVVVVCSLVLCSFCVMSCCVHSVLAVAVLIYVLFSCSFVAVVCCDGVRFGVVFIVCQSVMSGCFAHSAALDRQYQFLFCIICMIRQG